MNAVSMLKVILIKMAMIGIGGKSIVRDMAVIIEPPWSLGQ